MSATIHPLRREDRNPADDPTGESLLDRKTRPWDIWVPAYPALVLGNSQDPALELEIPSVLRDGIPVHRRISGGGAVLLSPGCVCMALRFRKRKELAIRDYFELGSSLLIATARERLNLDLYLRGTSDLACAAPDGDRKVAGSSLYMPRDFVLYLVSLLIVPDLEAVSRYLAHPSKEPDYRAGRSHADFLAGLASLAGRDLAPREFAQWLGNALPGDLNSHLDWELAQS